MEPVRVGLVGLGVMGADHAHRLMRRIAGVQLVAASDPDSARAREVLAGLPDMRTVSDPLDLIADDEVEAVLLASPGQFHEEQLLACIAAAKPVLCEKPLTLDEESSLRVLEAERHANRPLVQVGFMRRFDPEYAALKVLVDSGELGGALVVHNVHRNLHAPNQEFRSEMIVRDSLVHEVDIARWLFGEEIVGIHVVTPTPSTLAPDGVLDPQVTLFRMSGGGVVTNEVFVNSQVGYEVRCEVVAERGNATVGRESGILTVGTNGWGGVVPNDYRVRFARAYDLEVQAWVDSCRSGQQTGPGVWDGYAATAVCTAGMRSLREGGEVEVELAVSD